MEKSAAGILFLHLIHSFGNNKYDMLKNADFGADCQVWILTQLPTSCIIVIDCIILPK